jgi:tRNA(Arg) A34 adenosine deaminase TadA
VADFNHRVAVSAGLLADEAAALLQDFFRRLRDPLPEEV